MSRKTMKSLERKFNRTRGKCAEELITSLDINKQVAERLAYGFNTVGSIASSSIEGLASETGIPTETLEGVIVAAKASSRLDRWQVAVTGTNQTGEQEKVKLIVRAQNETRARQKAQEMAARRKGIRKPEVVQVVYLKRDFQSIVYDLDNGRLLTELEARTIRRAYALRRDFLDDLYQKNLIVKDFRQRYSK